MAIVQYNASNHTLEYLDGVEHRLLLNNLLLEMNRSTNKSHVTLICAAIKKILKYYLNIDMRPMFEWDLEGERNL